MERIMESFNAMNPLEEALLATQTRKVQPSKLFDTLYASQVFVLINKDLNPSGAWDGDTALLVLNSQSGIPVVAIFTSSERSVGWLERAGAFQHGLLVDFRWLLKGIAEGVGIVLNPGSSVGVELAPNIVQKLKESTAPNAKEV
jgi:hypothetical protein